MLHKTFNFTLPKSNKVWYLNYLIKYHEHLLLKITPVKFSSKFTFRTTSKASRPFKYANYIPDEPPFYVANFILPSS